MIKNIIKIPKSQLPNGTHLRVITKSDLASFNKVLRSNFSTKT